MGDGSWATATVVCVDDLPRARPDGEAPTVALLARGGRLLSDGASVAVVAFGSASGALDAAIAMQRDLRASDPVRVGIAAGDLAAGNDDRTSAAVFAARRLHHRAVPGQILATSHVLALARGVLDVSSRVLGSGGGDGFEVLWSPRGATTAAALPAPLAVAVTLGDRFVGRDTEWAELERAWNDVLIGAHRVVLVSGDVGAGKTRLAAEFASKVHRLGALVLYGGCDRDVRLPYQPWEQALEHVTIAPSLGPDDDLESLRRELAPLWPERPTGVPTVSDAAVDRHRMFEAVGALLAAAAAGQPVVLVLDDLHWAGPRSLALLRHLARADSCPNTLIIGTYRDAGVDHADELVTWLADMHRLLGVVRVRLSGLDQVAVETLLTAVSGGSSTDLGALAAAITERSGGNAFYVLELWRHLVASGMVQRSEGRFVVRTDLAWTAVPDSVKEVLAPRLRDLSPPALQLVQVAALAGERFDLDVVRAATAVDDDDLDRGLDELAESGLLARPAAAAYDGRHAYQFAHRLVRDTVEESMPPLMRSRLHLRLADAIEHLHGENQRTMYAELARHYGQAAPFAGHEKAVRYERCAADQAMRAAAYDEAIAHLGSALAHVEGDRRDRVEPLLELANAQLRRGLHADSIATCAEAFDLASRLDESVLVARAALAFEQVAHLRGLPGGDAVERVRAALAVVSHDEVATRARLHASLARALELEGRTAEALAAIDHALVIARHVADDEVLAHVLESASVALSDPHRQLAIADELSGLAGRAGDMWRQSYAESIRFRVEVGLGRLDDAAATLERHRRLSRQGHFPMFEGLTLSYESVLALAAARFDEAEDAAERARALGADDAPFDAAPYALQMLAIRREQGRAAEVLPLIDGIARSRAEPVWRAAMAALYADLGMVDETARELASLVVEPGGTLARDALRPAMAAFLADAVAELGDESRAAVVAAELSEFRGRSLMAGMTTCLGPADRPLARLTALLGRRSEAEALFGSARDLAARSGSPVWRVRVEHDWARFLAGHEPRRAFELGVRAARDAGALGMQGIARRPIPGASPLRVRHWPPPADRGPLSARELDVIRLVAGGCSNREIGARLFISSNTAANHIRAILQKTGCANRAQAVAYAASRHLLDDLA